MTADRLLETDRRPPDGPVPTVAWTSTHRVRLAYAPFVVLSPSWERYLALSIIILQGVWAIAVPIKNVVMMTNPEFRADSTSTQSDPYVYSSTENATVVIPGSDIVPLLQSVLAIAIGQRLVRENFESAGSFDLDTSYQLLAPEDYHIMSRYYALLFQTVEFPGTTMTPRTRYFDIADHAKLPLDALGVWIRPTDVTKSDWFLPISCAAENVNVDGTRCFQGNTSHVCYDFPLPGDVRRHEDVKLDSFRTNTGLANSIGQLYLIEVFHKTMSALFSTKNWRKALDVMQYTANADSALTNAYASVYSSDGRPLMLERFAEEFGVPLSSMNTTNVESCTLAEILTSRFYVTPFVLKFIQTTLLELNMYDVHEALVQPPNQTEAIVSATISHDLFLTSGARYKPVSDAGSRRFAGVTLASVSTATARLKLDTKFNGEHVFGSSVRMLMYMAYYPGFYSYLHHNVRNMLPNTNSPTGIAYDEFQYSILGGAGSGLNTFKDNWWGNTMGVYRLRELPLEPDRARRIDAWWDDEVKFASWFANLERTPQAPFRLFDKYVDVVSPSIVTNDNLVTACHRAFFKTLTKIAFLSLLSNSQLPSYAMFMSNINGGAPTWFRTTMLRAELYGEMIGGDRFAFSFTEDAGTRKDDGSAWVAVPILYAMLQNFGRNESMQMLSAEYNKSFVALVATEYGIVHFPDMGQCRVGFATANVSAADNTRDKVALKLYSGVMKTLSDLLDVIPTLRAQMASELKSSDGIEMVSIRDELIRGSPAGPAGDATSGSPVFWSPTAFTAGMLKLWPRSTPPPSTIAAYRNATTCYATLELRYLNESVRCWVEPNHVQKTRVEHKSVLMGKVVFSIWSTSLVLNSIASFIAAGFIWRLIRAWRLTKFRCVGFWVALQLNFQGFGVLSFAQTALLTASTVPLLIGYHIPVDNVFIVNQSTQHVPKLMKDVLVTLGASWFYRFGFEVANHFVVLQQVSYWFSNFRLRVLSGLLVFVARIASPDRMTSSGYELAKLLLTCGVSMALGVGSALLPAYRQSHAASHTTAVAPMQIKRQSIVVASISKHAMPLNKYGLVGFSSRGWSLAGLIVEGWEIVRREGKTDQLVAVKGICRIPLTVDERGEIKCLL